MALEPEAPSTAVDPEIAAGLPPELREPLTLDNLQKRRVAMLALLGVDGPALVDEAVGRPETVTIPGNESYPALSALVIRPSRGTGPWPGVYHIHGGGMIMGDERVGIPTMIEWMREVDFVVVSVGYRLAPEHPHPAPVQDCYRGLVWTATHASALDIDPSRLVIVGASAGGGLAAGTALMTRDLGGPHLAQQILMAPMIDDRLATRSSFECSDTGSWARSSSLMAWEAVLGHNRGGPDVSAYAAAARAADLRGLPPAFIDVGGAEIIRDESIEYATRLLAAGVPVELHVWRGGVHGFDVHVPQSLLAKACHDARVNYLRRVIRTRSP